MSKHCYLYKNIILSNLGKQLRLLKIIKLALYFTDSWNDIHL